jgi:hypothetical protein
MLAMSAPIHTTCFYYDYDYKTNDVLFLISERIRAARKTKRMVAGEGDPERQQVRESGLSSQLSASISPSIEAGVIALEQINK